MKIFISQPMKGKTEKQVKAERDKVIKKILKVYPDAEFIDSWINYAPKDATPVWYIGESIKLLSDADAVYFMDGYEENKGCLVELMICTLYGINELTLDNE